MTAAERYEFNSILSAITDTLESGVDVPAMINLTMKKKPCITVGLKREGKTDKIMHYVPGSQFLDRAEDIITALKELR